ncbi:hypothetical protein AGMMS49587_02170 [Spirochaetia bacterium]|nr:hypothetical protein AGMMS49587_02170 [Spirochaetia bacterium]
MADNLDKTAVTRLVELGEREATVLEHGSLKVMIDDQGGMIPELSTVKEKSRINAHWQPWFRSNSGKPYSDAEHGFFWKGNLLYHIAGNFPCAPNFGPGHFIDGLTMPPHGWTANLKWQFINNGIDEETGAAWALSSMKAPSGGTEKKMPLSFRKIDALLPGQSVHYSSLEIQNFGNDDLEINCGWHNTLGTPFLAPECRISAAAKCWTSAPLGGEFDATTRLNPETEFSSLTAVPLFRGGKADLSRVPPPIGYTDFVTGLIPESAHLGWSALVNPALKLAYLCFFTGPRDAAEDDIILRFNDLWMQYGGRPFTPWAPYEGGTDLTYCLGTENAIAAYSYGLEYSRQTKQLMGAPVTVLIPAGKTRTLRYGVLFAPYGGNTLDGGIDSLEAEESLLICKGRQDSERFAADTGFGILKEIQKKLADLS